MELFGPFCSPFCRNKVEGVHMNAPVHIGGRFQAERAFWRKTSRIAGSITAVLVLVLGFWFWYAWFGSVPGKYFSIRWDAISHSGGSWLVGKDDIVFLHGGTLAHYNLHTKQKVWSLDLVTPQMVADELKQEDDESTKQQHETGEASADILQPQHIREKYARIGLESALYLCGSGKNIWVEKDDILTHYDWATGNVLQQVACTNDWGHVIEEGDDFLSVTRNDDGTETITHISMDSGQVSTEAFGGAAPTAVAKNAPRSAMRGPTTSSSQADGGLPLNPNGEDKPMNPQKVAQQVQNLTLPARIALPALIGSSEHQRQINREIKQEDQQTAKQQNAQVNSQQQTDDLRNSKFIPDGDTYIAYSELLLEEKFAEHDAMKAPPKHSALDNPNISTANEMQAVNDQLNEMQRNNGGGTVTEDVSRYQVSLRLPNSPSPDWIGEVIGPPQFCALKTVDVITAGRNVIVFDKTIKKLWQTELSYPVEGGGGDEDFGPSESLYGAGPCVETNGTLYIYDQAVLTAFDVTSGTVRWRIPSVGIAGLFFDDKGMLYVNTTSENPDDLKYSRQIDVTKSTEPVLLKVDPSKGTVLWSTKPGAHICYVSGQYLYAYMSNDPGDEEDQLSDATAGLTGSAMFRLFRIDPANGKILWQHEEERAPVDVKFYGNFISLIFKKEVEVLHYITL